MSELKRCPFCGDEVEIFATGLYHWKYAIHHKNKTECILDANAFVLPYEEEDAVRMWNTRSDRKTESDSKIPNNSTISKMEQVDKPQTCDTCKWGEWYRQGYDITMMDDECGGCCSWNSKWTPKDEPQTCSVNGRPYTDCCNCEYHKCTADEPQTSRKTCRYGEVDEGYVRCAYYSKSTEQTEPQQVTGKLQASEDETTERQRLEGKRWTDALTIEEKKQLLDGWIVDEPQTERSE